MGSAHADGRLQSLGRKRLAQWLKKTRMSQREAATILGVHFTHVNQILNGKRSVGLALALRIEASAGIPVRAWAATVVAVPVETIAESDRNA